MELRDIVEKSTDSFAKQKILVFTDYYLPGYKAGGPVRTLSNMFKALESFFEYYVITRDRDICDNIPYSIETEVWHKAESCKILYISEKRITPNFLKSLISNLRPYKIYLNSFFSFRFSILPLLVFKEYRHQIVLAPRGEFSQGALEIKPLKKRIWIDIANVFGVYRDIIFHASSSMESMEIDKQLKPKEIRIGQDFTSIVNRENLTKPQKLDNSLKLCFISRISPKKNLLYALHTLSKFINEYSSVSFTIYGIIEDANYWEKCLQIIKNNHLDKHVFYKGILLPKDVIATFRKFDFFLFPTMGENFGHVIHESLLAGTPVIIPDNTFWNKYREANDWGFIYRQNKPGELYEILIHCYKMSEKDYEIMSSKAEKLGDANSELRTIVDENLTVFR